MRDKFRDRSPVERRQKYRKVLRKGNRSRRGQTERMRRTKWGNKKKVIRWRVWKEVVVSLWSRFLLGLELDTVLIF